MKNALSTVFALFALANVGLAADNTLGTWKYNTAKSKPASGMSRIKDLTVTREAAGDAVKVSAKGEREDGSKIDSTTTSSGAAVWTIWRTSASPAATVTCSTASRGHTGASASRSL